MNPSAQANPQIKGKHPSPTAAPQAGVMREIAGIKLHHTLDEDFSVYPPATFVERGFATCIDYFVMSIFVTFLKLPFLQIMGRLELQEQLDKMLAINLFLFFLAFIIYQIAPQVLWGQTLGKTFFGIRVVTLENSSKVSVLQITKRELIGKSLSAVTMGLGFLMMLVRADKRCMHDLICDTKVVKFRR